MRTGGATIVLSALLVALGLTAIARTIAAGTGGGFGLLLGAVLVLTGALRLYLSVR